MKQLVVLCGMVLGLMLGGHLEVNAQGSNNSNPVYPSWVLNGEIPQNVAIRLAQEARPVFQQAFDLSLGQLIQRYQDGQLTIAIEATSPPTVVVFRVTYGGISITVVDDSF
jgi:hypothetical protein